MKSVTPKRVRRTGRPADRAAFDAATFLSTAGSGRSIATYRRKEFVFRQNDPADAVYYINRGKVTITVLSEHGKEAIISQLGVGDFLGEGCLAGQMLRMSSAVAMADSVMVKIEKKAMVATLHEDTDFAEVFNAYLLSRNSQIEADLIDQLFNSVERRLARLLLLLANFAKEGKMEMVIPKISQDVLAARIGTTRSRVNFFMNKFRKLGFIEYDDTANDGGASLKVHTSSLLNVVVHD